MTTLEVVESYPELAKLTDRDIRDVLRNELLPVIRALVYKEGTKWFVNTQYIYDRLRLKAAIKAAKNDSRRRRTRK